MYDMDGTKQIDEIKGNNSKFLFFAVIVANLSMLTGGTTISWTSSAQVKLEGKKGPENNPLDHNLTTTEASTIASLISIGLIAMAPLAGPISDQIGRKWTLILGTLINVAAHLITAFANTTWQFYIARLMNGMSLGVIYVVIPNYTAEISDKHNRGFYGSLLSLFSSFGKMVMFVIGPFLTIQLSTLLCLIPVAVFMVCFPLLIPESPFYLVAKGRIDEASEALAKFRSKSKEDVKEEVYDISKSVEESFERKAGFLDLVRSKVLRKRLLLLSAVFTFQQASGINNIIFYMQTIFSDAGSELPSEYASIIVGIVQFVSTFITPPLMDRLGRRILLMLSTAILSLMMCGLATFFTLKYYGQNVDAITWLPIFCLVGFLVGYNLGIGPVGFVLLGELFPPHVKAVASAFALIVMALTTYVVTLVFPFMVDSWGNGISFFCFTAICIAAFVFSYVAAPETKGKSLTEIYEIKEAKEATEKT